MVALFSGIGGGFNEREEVEYIKRDSDGEYDDVSCDTIFTPQINNTRTENLCNIHNKQIFVFILYLVWT